MKIRNSTLAFLAAMLLATPAAAQVARYEVHFPNLPGYETVLCDLHMHTVFSDGEVWPTARVEEAFRQGYHLIAITDHIEYLEHPEVAATDLNQPYTLAAPLAKAAGILLARGAEITRKTPPGHYNAIFLNDVNRLKTDDFVEAIKRANEQGAFVFWNHHAWKGDERGRWTELQTTLYQNGWLHGMEIYNGVLDEYYPEAHRLCLEKNLTMLGNSDSHLADVRAKAESGDHRVANLVFAKARTLEALKEALMARRTAVWVKDRLIGRREILEPLLKACLRVGKCDLRSEETVWFKIENTSSMDIKLQRTGQLGPRQLTLPALATSFLEIETDHPDQPLTLAYTATNFLVAPDTGLPVRWTIAGP